MQGYCYYNGCFAPAEDIRISLEDRAIYFGDGIYDAAIGKDGKIYLLEEHINRFQRNAARLKIKNPYSHDELSAILYETVKRADIPEFFIYFQLSRKSDGRVHSYCRGDGVNLLVLVTPFSEEKIKPVLDVITTDDLRYYLCDVKTINLLPSVLAAGEADEQGCDEAIFLRGGIVTECAHSNIFILKNKTLYTHPTGNLILPGITRRHLILAGEELGIKTVCSPFPLSELMCADEIIITSTTKFARPVGRVDGTPVGGGDRETADRLAERLRRNITDGI